MLALFPMLLLLVVLIGIGALAASAFNPSDNRLVTASDCYNCKQFDHNNN